MGFFYIVGAVIWLIASAVTFFIAPLHSQEVWAARCILATPIWPLAVLAWLGYWLLMVIGAAAEKP